MLVYLLYCGHSEEGAILDGLFASKRQAEQKAAELAKGYEYIRIDERILHEGE